jgi:hypothetical protein
MAKPAIQCCRTYSKRLMTTVWVSRNTVVCWLSSETRQIYELMGLRHARLGKGETLLGTIKLTCRSDGHGWLILNVTVRLAISIGQDELQA